jgi:hypothetical protein
VHVSFHRNIYKRTLLVTSISEPNNEFLLLDSGGPEVVNNRDIYQRYARTKTLIVIFGGVFANPINGNISFHRCFAEFRGFQSWDEMIFTEKFKLEELGQEQQL